MIALLSRISFLISWIAALSFTFNVSVSRLSMFESVASKQAVWIWSRLSHLYWSKADWTFPAQVTASWASDLAEAASFLAQFISANVSVKGTLFTVRLLVFTFPAFTLGVSIPPQIWIALQIFGAILSVTIPFLASIVSAETLLAKVPSATQFCNVWISEAFIPIAAVLLSTVFDNWFTSSCKSFIFLSTTAELPEPFALLSFWSILFQLL